MPVALFRPGAQHRSRVDRIGFARRPDLADVLRRPGAAVDLERRFETASAEGSRLVGGVPGELMENVKFHHDPGTVKTFPG